MAGHDTRRPRTESPEKRRRQLIDATITSISRHGISGTTMTSVTRLAGLSLGLANFHFRTKDALLQETLRFLAEEHRNQWHRQYEAADLTAAEKLRGIVAAQFHPRICSRKRLRVWFAFYGEAPSRKSYRAVTERIDSERLAALTALFGDIVGQGGYSGVRPGGAARTMEALFDGFWLNMLMYPDTYSREDAIARVMAYLARTFPDDFAAGQPQ